MTPPVWRWIEESQQLALDTRDRQLTISWDDGDRGWFLAVIKPPRTATMGQPAVEAETYICPLPLLAAMVLTPPSLHPHLLVKVSAELAESRGAVFAHLATAAGDLPTVWPGTIHAGDALRAATEHVAHVERLSMDWAAAGAFTG